MQEPLIAKNGEIIADPLFRFKVDGQNYACFGKDLPRKRIIRKLEDFKIIVVQPGEEIAADI